MYVSLHFELSVCTMSWRDGLNEEEEEEEEDEQLGSDHVIFLIDARMEFEAIRHCLTVLLSVAKAKVVAENKSNVGVVFFGTEHKNAEDGSPENIFTLFSLDPPSAARIKLIAVNFLYPIVFYTE